MAFSGEIYLRTLTQRLLAVPGLDRGTDRAEYFYQATQALLAIDAVGADQAIRLTDDFVGRLAGEQWGSDRRGRDVWVNPDDRAITLTDRFDTPAGRMCVGNAVRHHQMWLTFSALVRTADDEDRSAELPALPVYDDRGAELDTRLALSSTVAPRVRRGELAVPGVRPDAEFLQIAGHRVDLGAGRRPPAPPIRHLVADDRVTGQLWAAAAIWHGQASSRLDQAAPPNTLAATVEALQAAGALRPDDPRPRRVLQVLGYAGWSRQRAGQPRGLPVTPAQPTHWPWQDVDDLPGPWRSVMERLGGPEPAQTTQVVEVAACFGGLDLRIGGLVAVAGELMLPGLAGLVPGPHRALIGHSGRIAPAVQWWAQDDRDNWYLGRCSDSGPWLDDRLHSVDLQFTPSLDPQATRLQLCLTLAREQGEIAIPLR